MANIKTPRGTSDLFGEEVRVWQKFEEIFRGVSRNFGVSEIRTPIFEHTELFLRGVGETTDVVQKEMYTFTDKGERSITLKPEGTAGVVRSFIEHKMYSGTQPTKLYYIAPLFRYENPQAGRSRQFHQYGIEIFSSYSPLADAEVISIADELLRRIGIKNTTLYINSLGGAECRTRYNNELKAYIQKKLDCLCETCQARFEKNPLRILDCKNKDCQSVLKDVPTALQTLGKECRENFEKLQAILKEMGIEFIVDERLVRGLDYYTRTVFEFKCEDLGAQNTICAGGRYDNLVSSLGGPATGAVGFGMGIERLIIACEKQGVKFDISPVTDIFIGYIGNSGMLAAQKLVFELRKNGIIAESDIIERNVKSQFKYADKIGAKFSLIIGDDEIAVGKAKLKNMSNGEQTEVEFNDYKSFLNFILLRASG